jgi:hypothetical protein
MRVLIHASLDLRDLILHAAQVLKDAGADVLLPDLQRYQHIRDVEGRQEEFDQIKHRLSRENAELVASTDVLYILNADHRNIPNYVGGNSFYEMSIAFFLNRPIWLMNEVPDNMPYTEEIRSFFPKIVGCAENVIREGLLFNGVI